MYAEFEVRCQSPRRAVAIYERALKKLKVGEKMFEIYQGLIALVSDKFGIVETRKIYQEALETLEDHFAIKMGLEFSNVEKKLGEIDRARAILAYTSQMCNPALKEDFWQAWQDFEVEYGNDDTVREMLRIKRSVQVKYTGAHAGFVASTLVDDENNDQCNYAIVIFTIGLLG